MAEEGSLIESNGPETINRSPQIKPEAHLEEAQRLAVVVDLKANYQTRIDRFKAGQIEVVDKFSLLKNRVEEEARNRPVQEKEQFNRTFNWQDRLRHKALLAEARLKGVKDLKGFQRLVEYFETTLTDKKSVWQNLGKKEPTEEKKAAIIEKWESKGYYATTSGFHNFDGSWSFSTSKTIPLNLDKKYIPALKELLASNPDPISVIQTMREANMYYSNTDIYPSDKLKSLLTAPHSKEVMDIVKAIPNWGGSWLPNSADTSNPIDNIITIAESDTSIAAFTPDVVEKIKVLSQLMERPVFPAELPKYQQLVNNPEQFNFLVTLLSHRNYSLRDIPIFDNIDALQQAHLLEPLTILSKNGVVIDKPLFTTGRPERYGEQPKTQAEIIQRLQETINSSKVQEYLQEPEKQAFVGLVAQISGSKISLSQVEEALGYFDKKEELVYLYDLVYTKPEDRMKLLEEYRSINKIPLGVVSFILNEPSRTQFFTSREFNIFLNELKTQGYEPRPDDFYSYQYKSNSYRDYLRPGSVLAEVYDLKDIITVIGKDTPADVLDNLKRDESKAEYYKILLRQPHIIETLQILKGYNLLPPDGDSGLPDLNKLININEMFLLQKSVVDAIPVKDRQQWLESALTLPEYAQNAILDRILQMGVIDSALIQRVSDLATTFKQIDILIPEVTDAEHIKTALSTHPGEITDLFKNGKATSQLARQFLNNRNFTTLHAVLTDEILNTFDESVRTGLSIWRGFSADVRDTVVNSFPEFPHISPERLVQLRKAAEVINIIKNSPSKEIQRLQNELAQQLWQTEDPQFYLKQIIQVFERNNLPLVGKIYRVFEILHPPQKFEKKIRSNPNLSPVLVGASTPERYNLIYKDLLKIAIDSGNPSLQGFLKALDVGQQVITDIEQNGAATLEGPENFGKREAAIRFLNRLDTLYANSNYGRSKGSKTSAIADIEIRIAELKANLGIKGDQPLIRRISAMFLRPLGYSSIEQVLKRMDAAKAEANSRNIQFAKEAIQGSEGFISLKSGDLLKGIKIKFLENILANGSLAKEYLGASADSDMTPFDTDTSMVLPDDAEGGFENTIRNSLASGYGNLLLVIRDRGQFQRTDKLASPTYDKDKYEIFGSKIHGERHIGIRTGIASTEIDAFIAEFDLTKNDGELERVFFTIAQNEIYIPVVDKTGKILFTPELFEQYKIKNKTVQEILRKTDFKPEELIDTLKQSPFIKRLYESSVGVWEGYNLDEHTLMVMSQYEKYFADRWRSPLVSQEAFRMMLALHDLGKPLAVQITGNPANQHEYTSKFLPKIIEGAGLGPRETEVMVAVANQDNLGQYLQGNLDLQTTARNIKTIAEDSGVPVTQLYELIKMYFMCDAGAYTEDAGGKAALDNLFVFEKPSTGKGQMKLSEATQQRVDKLGELLITTV